MLEIGNGDGALGLQRLTDQLVYPLEYSSDPLVREALGIRSVTRQDGEFKDLVMWAMCRVELLPTAHVHVHSGTVRLCL